MNDDDLIRRLAVALAIGLLVGAERHWRERDASPGQRTAGVRTFTLIGLLGGVVAALSLAAGPLGGAVLLGMGLAVLVAALLPFALREAEAEANVSATSMIAAIATFALGALAVAGQATAAGAAAVAMVAVLAARDSLHGLMARVTWAEMRSAILLLSMTLVALPLVPDQPIAWLAGLNPNKVWTLAILLAGISFLGYLAVRLGGARRGLLLAGAAGGLVSSTAVTLANATATMVDGPARALAAGALVAGAVSCLRTVGLALLVAPGIARILWPALVAAAIAMGVTALVLSMRADTAEEAPKPPANPFEIGAVLRMAALLGGVGILATLGANWLGGGAVIVIAAVTGLTDVDAITLSMPQLVPAVISPTLAARAVAVAVASNIVAKAVYAASIGNRAFWRNYGIGSLVALGAGGAVLLATAR